MVVVVMSVFVTILVMKLVKAEKKSMREMETQTERWELENVKSENVFLKGDARPWKGRESSRGHLAKS